MKQKDLLVFITVGILSAVLSFVTSSLVITPSKNKKQQAEIVTAISDQFDVPAADNKYFNKDAINPTKLIQIGDGVANNAPFNGTSQ